MQSVLSRRYPLCLVCAVMIVLLTVYSGKQLCYGWWMFLFVIGLDQRFTSRGSQNANVIVACTMRLTALRRQLENGIGRQLINPLRPNSDLSQTSHCNIKGLSVSEVMRIENIITQMKFY